MIHRIAAFGPPREHDIEACARALFETLERLRAASDRLAFEVASAGPFAGRAITTRKLCSEALESGAIAANMGDPKRPMRAFRLRLRGSVADLDVVTGIDLDTRPLWKANRLELAPAVSFPPREVLAMLTALVQPFEADWGFAGGELVPSLPPFGAGTPAIGWATYLAVRHGALPAFPAPASVMAVQGGAIVVAQPEPFDERRRRDLDNVRAVREALGATVLQTPPLPFDEVDPSIAVELVAPTAPTAPVAPEAELSGAPETRPMPAEAPLRPAPHSEPPPSAPTRPFVLPATSSPVDIASGGTVDNVMSPFHGRADTGTPFSPYARATPAGSNPTAEPAKPAPTSSPLGSTAVSSGGTTAAAAALPFAGGVAAGRLSPDEVVRKVSLGMYAAVVAEVRVAPARSEVVFRRYGLGDPATRAAVDAFYKEELTRDPALRAQFEELIARAQSSMR